MNLSDLIVDTKSAWIEYPGYEGFEVELAALSRPELANLRKRCISTSWDKKTHRAVESLDEDKFLTEFSKSVIKNWKGFKAKYVESLLLADVSALDPEQTIAFSPENAKLLISQSTEFDTWVNDTVFDLENFRSQPKGGNVEKA